MNHLILTTQKTNKAYVVAGLIESLIYFGIGMYFLPLSEKTHGKNASTLVTATSVMCIVAIINFLNKLSFSTSYVNVYTDKILGKGIQQLVVRNFELNYKQINDISYTGRTIRIATSGGEYKIITNAEKAKEIFDYYNQIKSTIGE